LKIGSAGLSDLANRMLPKLNDFGFGAVRGRRGMRGRLAIVAPVGGIDREQDYEQLFCFLAIATAAE
jgi:hypothetical protein